MRTPIYLKMDAPDQLLLSEGVCRQLDILTYHNDVERWQGRHEEAARSSGKVSPETEEAKVLMV